MGLCLPPVPADNRPTGGAITRIYENRAVHVVQALPGRSRAQVDASHLASLHTLVLHRPLFPARWRAALDTQYGRRTVFYFSLSSGLFAPGTGSQHLHRAHVGNGSDDNAV